MWWRKLIPEALKPLPRPEPFRGELSLEQKASIRQWLRNPDTQLAFRLAEAARPSVLSYGGVPDNVAKGNQSVLNFFHFIRGWEAAFAFLHNLAEDKPKYREPVETFPEGEDEL